MANISTAATQAVSSRLTTPVGSDFKLNSIAASLGATVPLALSSVLVGNVGADLLEHAVPLRYPAAVLYCDKLTNTLKEKFRTFSGTARVVLEIRHSQDRVENLETTLQHYVDASCQVLDSERGDWGGGLYYAGGYEVAFAGVKKGGRQLIQTARISIDVEVSI